MVGDGGMGDGSGSGNFREFSGNFLGIFREFLGNFLEISGDSGGWTGTSERYCITGK